MSTIQEGWGRIKRWWGTDNMALLSPFLVILVGISSFMLGRLSMIEAEKPMLLLRDLPTEKREPLIQGGLLVASRNGSSYHYPWCAGAETIKPANRVWFENEAAAKKAGYKPAGNCNGLVKE